MSNRSRMAGIVVPREAARKRGPGARIRLVPGCLSRTAGSGEL